MKGRVGALLLRLGGRRGRAATVLTLTFAATILFAAPAAAAPADPNPNPSPLGGTQCASAPAVQSPGAGVTSSLMPPRQPLPAGTKPSMFETYGLAGLNFDTYDVGWDAPTGCIPNNVAIDGGISDMIANALLTAAAGLAALADSLMRTGYDTGWMQVFDPFVLSVTNRLRDSVFHDWAIAAFGVIGLLLIWRARKGNLSDATSLMAGGLTVFCVLTAVFAWPVWLGHTYDHSVSGFVGKTTDVINGDSTAADGVKRTPDQSLMNSLYDNVFQRAWLAGNFGDPDSPTAQQFGARLFAAHALSWDELDKINADAAAARKDPDFGGIPKNPFGYRNGYCLAPGDDRAVNPDAYVPCYALPMYQKQADYQKVAEQIKQSDPAAYSYLQGVHGQDRIGYAFLALLAVLLSLPVIIMGSLSMAVAFLFFRFILIAAPVIGPIAMVRTGLGLSLFDRAASIAVTAFVWGIGIPVVEIFNGAVLTANINPVARLLLLAVIFIGSMIVMIAYAPGFGGVVKKRHAKRGARMLEKAAGWWFAGKIAKAASRSGAAEEAPPGDDTTSPYGDDTQYQAPTVDVTVSDIPPDPEDHPALPGRIAADRGLPEAPVSGQVLSDTALSNDPPAGTDVTERDPGVDGPRPAARVLDDDEDVYVVTDLDGFERDPADFDSEAWDDDSGEAALPAGGEE